MYEMEKPPWVSGDLMERAWPRIKAQAEARINGLVYFIRCGEFVKIGYSVKPKGRLAECAIHNPYECELIGEAPGGYAREVELHKKYAHLLHRNEWFRATPELLADIASICA